MENSEDQFGPAEAAARLVEVRLKIDQAARRVGRAPTDVTLLGVSKTFPATMVQTFVQAGLQEFGESYIQEAKAKITSLADLAAFWHFIGHLQTNKAKLAASLFSTIHSLDSLELAQELNHRAEMLGRCLNVYIQVNVANEDSKSGLAPGALPAFLDQTANCSALNFMGLMTIPPYDPDPEVSRPHFAALRQLRDQWAPHLKGLSMGMSGDFEAAIEEGATIIRVGTTLFGRRDKASA